MPAPSVSDNLCGLGFAGPAALYLDETFIHSGGNPSNISNLLVTVDGTTESLADWLVVNDAIYNADGQDQYVFLASPGQVLNLALGTDAVPQPQGGLGPVIKASRTMEYTGATGSGDNSEHFSAISGSAAGVGAMKGQPIGVLGTATNSSASPGGGGLQPDACAIYGIGNILDGGVGVAIGAFLAGQIDGTGGSRITAVEAQVRNYSGVAGVYNPTGFSAMNGHWITVVGDADASVGISLGNPAGFQFEVGLGFNAQVVGGKTGPVSGSSIRDMGTAPRSIDVRGSHTIAFDASQATLSGGVLYAPNGVSILRARNNAADNYDTLLFYDSTDTLRIGSTDSVGVSIRNAMDIRGAQAAPSNSSDFILYDSNDEEVIRMGSYGRIDMFTYYTDGSLIALGVRPVTPANGQRMGHYAFTGLNSAGNPNTLAIVEALITDITEASMDSSISLRYSDSVDGTGGYQQPNREVRFSKDGVDLPSIDIMTTTTIGSRFGGDATRKIAFYGATPVVQPTAVADASGGAVIDAEARTALNALLARMRTLGAIAT